MKVKKEQPLDYEGLREISRLIQEAAKQGNSDAGKILKAIVDEGYRIVTAVSKAVTAVFEAFRKWKEENIEQIQEAIVDLVKAGKCFLDEEEKEHTSIYQVFREHDWPVPMHMQYGKAQQIIELTQLSNQPRSTLNKLMIEYFESEGHNTLQLYANGWDRSPVWDATRGKILMDCIHTMSIAKKTYNPSNVVVPTLISQIEGIRNQYLIYQGCQILPFNKFLDQSGNKSDWKSLLRSSTPDNSDEDDIACELLLDILFKEAHTKVRLPSRNDLNRHKILHGESVRYGRRDIAYRFFLILDYLLMLR
ncbi:MAG: hypothetical protein J4G05_12350 [Chlorobi bacterium]|nr:hypothetical protein [Chlorobiota bacterium]